MFTAVATLQLVQRGALELDASVGTYLPAYANQGVATRVTLHHLLSHTGGTGDFFGPAFDEHRLELRTHDDYLALHGARELEFEPGSQWRYRNYGFLLLGAIIEKVTRKPYYDVVQANVYERAGMTKTSSPPEDVPMRGRSIGYTRASKNGLLDAAHTAMLTTPKPGTPADIAYGYGFSFAERAGVRCIGHGGGAPGMNGDLAICDNGYTVAVLANLDPPAAGVVADFILARLPASAATPAP
jgi:CubicO group peptidase (beta-lactamase class C family)